MVIAKPEFRRPINKTGAFAHRTLKPLALKFMECQRLPRR
jgi:hypothetical protein